MKYGICTLANGSTLWIRAKSPAAQPSFTHDPHKALCAEAWGLVDGARKAIESARPLLRGKLAVEELPKHNPVNKSRAARMRVLSARVAKAAAGSAYNKAKRKPRKLQYIARGTSKAAANAFGKWAKKLKLNPGKVIFRSVEGARVPTWTYSDGYGSLVIRKESGRFYVYRETFSEKTLLGNYANLVNAKTAAVAAIIRKNPSTRDEIARAQSLFHNFTGHDADHGTKVRANAMHTALQVGPLEGLMYTATRDGKTERYFHKFSKKSRPLLIANFDGSQIGIVGGRYEFTDRGIVDT